MVIQNNTSVQILCITKEKEEFFVLPKCKENIELNKENSILEIYHLYNSGQNHLFDVDNIYHIVINSKITVTQVKPDSYIVVSGEIVHFEFGYVYDKFLFHTQNCTIASENCLISNLSALQELTQESRISDTCWERITTFFLSGGFWTSTGLFVLFKLAFWANGWSFPWWLIVLYWALGYTIQLIGEKTAYKYIAKKQHKLYELSKYTSPEYVLCYFHNPRREWIADDRVDL